MKELITKGYLVPLGDIIDDKSLLKKKYFDRYEDIYKIMSGWRLSKETTRSKEDSEFHYKVDSLNVIISLAINNESRDYYLLFTTAQRENLELCKEKSDFYGRNPCVPLFILNSEILQQRNFIDSAYDFLKEALFHANKLLKKMAACKSFNDMPLFDVIKMREFYEFYIHNLNQETLTYKGPSEKTSKEEIISILSDPMQVKETFAKADQDLKNTAVELKEYYTEFDDGMTELFGLIEDPIAKKIKTNLNLS